LKIFGTTATLRNFVATWYGAMICPKFYVE